MCSRGSSGRDPLVYYQLPIWNMPAWALPGAGLPVGDAAEGAAREDECGPDLPSEVGVGEARFYCTHPLIGTCRVQLPGDGFNDWAEKLRPGARKRWGGIQSRRYEMYLHECYLVPKGTLEAIVKHPGGPAVQDGPRFWWR